MIQSEAFITVNKSRVASVLEFNISNLNTQVQILSLSGLPTGLSIYQQPKFHTIDNDLKFNNYGTSLHRKY